MFLHFLTLHIVWNAPHPQSELNFSSLYPLSLQILSENEFFLSVGRNSTLVRRPNSSSERAVWNKVIQYIALVISRRRVMTVILLYYFHDVFEWEWTSNAIIFDSTQGSRLIATSQRSPRWQTGFCYTSPFHIAHQLKHYLFSPFSMFYRHLKVSRQPFWLLSLTAIADIADLHWKALARE